MLLSHPHPHLMLPLIESKTQGLYKQIQPKQKHMIHIHRPITEETKTENPEMATAAAEATREADKPQQQQEDEQTNKNVVKPLENPPVRPPHQKCPRCNSLNTKFCYYINCSLNQPRYFCKTCRRYWTHGGTLRNVPIGGGCRKSLSKQIKTMASFLGIGEGNSRSQLPSQPLQSQVVPQQDAMVLAAAKPAGLHTIPILTAMRNREIGMQTFSQPQSTLNQPQLNLNQLNAHGQLVGGIVGGSGANLPYMQSLNSVPPPPLISVQQVQPQLNQIQVQRQSQMYQMGNIDRNMRPLIYPSDQAMVQPVRSNFDSLSNSWADIFLMSCSTSNITNNCTIPGTSSVNHNQLMPDLTGFGHPF